ncbi:hypothetical protein GGQ11_003311 [Salinibacter ruber]|uniref:Uncharacterized protein n=2 Tax=Salinibacter ruber TaxID=146919 RepID=A0A9X2U914_9BACT|nr:hypothetical protein [Salinibacter ruber]MCS3952015.1 hypothetical protein [Salinibacter ruber]MCS4118473.1 hypothetical protein [Salinibacter ruber]MCS4154164.1 hypothetical protein [Salinibacter ruber]MCS4170798.1 hypothetical protein [Salinibacter ruber]
MVGELSQAGRMRDQRPTGYWWAALPDEERPDDPQTRALIADR